VLSPARQPQTDPRARDAMISEPVALRSRIHPAHPALIDDERREPEPFRARSSGIGSASLPASAVAGCAGAGATGSTTDGVVGGAGAGGAPEGAAAGVDPAAAVEGRAGSVHPSRATSSATSVSPRVVASMPVILVINGAVLISQNCWRTSPASGARRAHERMNRAQSEKRQGGVTLSRVKKVASKCDEPTSAHGKIDRLVATPCSC
jgi:hypothetical protein